MRGVQIHLAMFAWKQIHDVSLQVFIFVSYINEWTGCFIQIAIFNSPLQDPVGHDSQVTPSSPKRKPGRRAICEQITLFSFDFLSILFWFHEKIHEKGSETLCSLECKMHSTYSVLEWELFLIHYLKGLQVTTDLGFHIKCWFIGKNRTNCCNIPCFT